MRIRELRLEERTNIVPLYAEDRITNDDRWKDDRFYWKKKKGGRKNGGGKQSEQYELCDERRAEEKLTEREKKFIDTKY